MARAHAPAAHRLSGGAAEVAIRAKRRAGELLPQAVSAGHQKANSITLMELEISEMDSSRWQAVASIPEERFEQHLAEEQAAGRRGASPGRTAC
jgi:hypothetical protein